MKELYRMEKDKLIATFLKTGDLFELSHNGVMINQLTGNSLDGSLNQIYLRVFENHDIKIIPLVGSNSDSYFEMDEDQLVWQGEFEGISYEVIFKLGELNTWFWKVLLTGKGQIVDLVYGQDIGNALKGAIQSNEAYISQYIDHHVKQVEGEIIVSSRQNQPQNGKFPVIEQGSLSKLKSFSTDGYQFFGKKYKNTNFPEALKQKELSNEVYQYEFSYIALQTEQYNLSEEKMECIFYGVFTDNVEQAVTDSIYSGKEMDRIYNNLDFIHMKATKKNTKMIGLPIIGEELTELEIHTLYPNRLEEEVVGDKLYSFFTNDYSHVVLKSKEIEMERAHGHLMLSGKGLTVDDPTLATTVYMYGIFNSQIVLGNTSMHKLISNSRNSLNVMKKSGQRIYILEDNKWRILTMPSMFVMGLNSATWYYKLKNDVIEVETYTSLEGREIITNVRSKNKRAYTWAISNEIIMGPSEELASFELTQSGNLLEIRPREGLIKSKYPELVYYYNLSHAFELTDETLFGCHKQKNQLSVFKISEEASFSISTQGSLSNEKFHLNFTTIENEKIEYLKFINDLLNDFSLSHPSIEVTNINVISRWYTHNMLVHYLSPHGLEQYGGAAWGTRDVSQGPTEFFLATGRSEIVASIIRKTYSNQFQDDGNWPQWFMFDNYEEQKASESHGDIIIWPLKIVSDYLEKTNNYSILNEKIPYTNRNDFSKTNEGYTLLNHIEKQISYIKNNFLHDTYLSSYGDGDWDDTLQPQNSDLKEYMVSTWTVALTYQILKKFSNLLMSTNSNFSIEIEEIVNGIYKDYKKYVLSEETIPGYIYLENPEEPQLMIHPKDELTGIQYRLLPMTRSMIAELLTPTQVEHHLKIIQENLYFPDGVHLMNRPARYTGGVSINFKRAEQAANFGREIGLQYVHAHIRFIEAMAKVGKKEETWKGLGTINPIGIQKRVKNAEIRQANTYFSSSDGNFSTRYEAQERFSELQKGNETVKGGWRLYSSGPGIYLNQLITNVLGIRETYMNIIFDPVLPVELDGLIMDYKLYGYPVKITFCLNSEKKGVFLNGEKLSTERERNPYRVGGVVVKRDELIDKLQKENHLEIYQ